MKSKFKLEFMPNCRIYGGHTGFLADCRRLGACAIWMAADGALCEMARGTPVSIIGDSSALYSWIRGVSE
jgi:hypothetical protein